MRTLLALAFLLAGCGDDDCCTGRRGVDAAPDGWVNVCEPTGLCSSDQGPQCGASCCASGEQCVDEVCMCGDSPACGPGDVCIIPGPVAPLTSTPIAAAPCGSYCCGASVGCPI